jgi:hypothetical protein
VKKLGRRLYEGWMVIAGHFGEVQTLLIVCAVYVFVVGPVALGAAAIRADLLAKRAVAGNQSAWVPADSTPNPDVERAQRLF